MGREDGQSTVELVAALPALLLAGLLALQLLATGYALTLADGAAEAGALALASGRPAIAAARGALPGWAGMTSTSRSGRTRHRAPATAVAAAGGRRPARCHLLGRGEAEVSAVSAAGRPWPRSSCS